MNLSWIHDYLRTSWQPQLADMWETRCLVLTGRITATPHTDERLLRAIGITTGSRVIRLGRVLKK